MADILIVDDRDRTIDMCRRALPENRYRGPARSWKETADLLSRARGRVDLVLLDVHFDIDEEALLGFKDGMTARETEALKRRQGLEILQRIRGRYPDLPVIVMTSAQDIRLEEENSKSGLEEYTYFLDDEDLDARGLQAQISGILDAQSGLDTDGPVFWGHALQMRRLRQKLRVVSRGRLPVVLMGETGTGKSLVARHFVHRESKREGGFVSLDLSTIPKDLMAAQLFGSVRGAYTGSISDRTGAFEAAHRGTLFLDEIGNLTMEAQKMLLAVLQEGRVARLGDVKERLVDVKLVVATNEDMADRVRSGTFRADLWMRLNPSAAVSLPRLVNRQLDFEQLINFCIQQAMARPYLRDLVQEYQNQNGISRCDIAVHFSGAKPEKNDDVLVLLFPSRSMRMLRAHHWPGNLREFSMVVENAVLFALSEMMGVVGGDRTDIIQIRPKLIKDMLVTTIRDDNERTGQSFSVNIQPQESLNRVAVECERQYFEMLYVREKGDFGNMAAVLLGDRADARKVQLRLNQLGLKVRELKEKIS